MALIVEDGTGIANANSYQSIVQFTAYGLLYGVVVNPATAETILRQAMDYIETRNIKGDKVDADQALQFPRDNLYINGVLQTQAQIFTYLTKAQNELGLAIIAGQNPLGIFQRKVKSKTFGPFSKTYADDDSGEDENPRVDLWLKPLLRSTGGPLAIHIYPNGVDCDC